MTIEWTDRTWNPIRGCSRISAGCQNCYAERMAARFSGPGQPYEGLTRQTSRGPRWTGDVRFVDDKLYEPARWRRPEKVFVNSMSDLFHDAMTAEQIRKVFFVMASTHHVYQVLTKRPHRARYFLEIAQTFDIYELPNVWLGVSAEHQAAFNDRVPPLLECPAAVRWVSLEPLLSPIDMSVHIGSLDWVVVGGESGPGARYCDAGWIEDIVRQCKAADVPVFVKQLGSKHKDHKDFDRWPDELRVREFPVATCP